MKSADMEPPHGNVQGSSRSGLRVKVALISPSMGGYGGLEAFVLALASGLAADDRLDLRVAFKKARGFALQRDLQIAIARLPVRVGFLERASVALFKMLAQAEVVHVQNPCPDVVFPARLLGKRLLVNVINHIGKGRSLHERLWRLGLRLAHRRFYISEFVRRTWEGDEIRRGSEVVHPICELADGTLPPSERRGFAFVSRWIPNKGIETLVQAYHRAQLDPVRWPLVLMGDGPLKQKIEREVAKVAGVQIVGFVGQEAKADALRRSRFVVIPPDTREDFGLVAIEARHLGVPCIVTRDGGLPEAAGDEALVCEPGDVEGLAGLLRRAASMEEGEYAGRSGRTQASLQGALVRPEFYAETYLSMARR